jgi:hypothetical protein
VKNTGLSGVFYFSYQVHLSQHYGPTPEPGVELPAWKLIRLPHDFPVGPFADQTLLDFKRQQNEKSSPYAR